MMEFVVMGTEEWSSPDNHPDECSAGGGGCGEEALRLVDAPRADTDLTASALNPRQVGIGVW